MTDLWTSLLIFTLIPTIFMAVGGVISILKQPSEKFISIVQHFAAGLVFAAVAIELLPRIIDQSKFYLSIGFIVGVALMITVKKVSSHFNEKNPSASQALPVALLIAVAIDIFIDGLLIGISFVADSHSGVVIALALALEILFIGLATTATMASKQINKVKAIIIIIIIALLVPFGSILGFAVVSQMSQHAQLLILSFGVAALLYLVTEELLAEAHKVEETVLATSAFFIGFLALLIFS